MFAWLKKLIPSKNEREVKKLAPRVQAINALEASISKLSDEELARQTVRFRERLGNGEPLDNLLPEAFATVRETGKRRMGMRHYDTQLIGGMVLNRGCISEMKTGEGKTLVATLPLYLNALEGRGAHLVTVNDYLARRDAEWMSRIYNFLGMSVGVIIPNLRDGDRKTAYGSDITYGTNNEFGFDYLRDNMKFRFDQYVHRYFPPPDDLKDDKARQKVLNFAIVDEVDSVLVDEARTPLIISGDPEQSSDWYHRVNAIIPFLRLDEDFTLDEKAHSVSLTETGVDKVEHRLKILNLYDAENILVLHHTNQALRAHYLYKKGQHYVVERDEVIIVDEFTGRKMEGRRWSDGLHQAVEAKEGVKVKEENQTLATITFQNFFRMYKKLSGMTGTAETEAEEFAKIYDLDVMVIPTNRPIQRTDHEDVIYKNEKEKLTAICKEIIEANKRGQPVLVGTTSVDKSEVISKVLNKNGIEHSVLNAKQHEREAFIIAQAGRSGGVTVATNMAGRGTDIMLGGNPEMMARQASGAESGEEFEATLARFKTECAAEKEQVIAAGGLYIVGTERHESRRIDNQLRGRAGRQGDPGTSRFYLSLDDELMRMFGGDRIKKMMEFMKVPDDEPIEHPMVSRSVENAQKRVEGHNFDIRKNLLDYDDVMNMQRRTIYDLRRNVLEGKKTPKLVLECVGDVVHSVCDQHTSAETTPDQWDFDALEKDLREAFAFPLEVKRNPHDFDELFKDTETKALAHYAEREARIRETIAGEWKSEQERARALALQKAAAEGLPVPENLPPIEVTEEVTKMAEAKWRDVEREVYLKAIDRLWKIHLVAMDHLRAGVHLNAYAQKDPKLIYKMEGFDMFRALLVRISKDVCTPLYRMEVQTAEAQLQRLQQATAQQAQKQAARATEGRGLTPEQVEGMRRAVAQAQAAAAAKAQAAKAPPPAAPAQAKDEDDDDELPEELADEGEARTASRPAPIQTVRRDRPKVGRNDPCHCGSGKKYKNCHFDQDSGTQPT